MKKESKLVRDSVVIGLALFSMFFGAGSLIFPPYLGMESGTGWFLGFICFILADIGLAFVTIVAMINGDGSISSITGVVGKIPALVINTAVIICIGPFLAIPRTAATTYEMSVLPVTSGINITVFSVIYFAIAWVLTIRPSRVVTYWESSLLPPW